MSNPDPRQIRLRVRSGYTTTFLSRPYIDGTPFAQTLGVYIGAQAGPALRRYRVTLMRGAIGLRTEYAFTFSGARRLQARMLDRAIARDRKLDAAVLEAARLAGLV